MKTNPKQKDPAELRRQWRWKEYRELERKTQLDFFEDHEREAKDAAAKLKEITRGQR